MQSTSHDLHWSSCPSPSTTWRNHIVCCNHLSITNVCHPSTSMVYQLMIHVDTTANNPAMTDNVSLAALYQHWIFTMYTASEFIPSLTLCGVTKHSTEHRNDERPAWATDLAWEVADIKTSVTQMDTISAKFNAVNAMVTSLDELVPTITEALKAIQTNLHWLTVLSARVCPLVFGQLTV